MDWRSEAVAPEDRPTLADIITASNVQDHMKHAQPTVFLEPKIGSIGLFDFHRLEEGIVAGRGVAQANMEALQRLASQVKNKKNKLVK